jgi:hypothetical protein
MKQITATPKVRCLTQTASPDPRSWLQHKTTSPPRSATTATTWRSLPSSRWHHVSDRSPTPTTSSQISRSTMAALTPTSGCRPTTSLSRRPAATSTTWWPTSRW